MFFKKIRLSFIVILALTCLLMFSGLGIVNLNKTNSTYLASGDSDSILSVNKVYIEDKSPTYNPEYAGEARHINGSEVAVVDNDFIVLNTTPINKEFNGVYYTAREAVYIKVREVGGLNVTIRFNDNLVYRNNYEQVDDNESAINASSFGQYLFALTPTEIVAANLHDTYYTRYATTNNTPTNNIDLPEGKYSVKVEYIDHSTTQMQSVQMSFYIVTEKTYNAVSTRPSFDDTYKITQAENSTYSTLHYFNFSNVQNNGTGYIPTDKYGVQRANTQQELYYPTLTFDPERYIISYKYSLYNYEESVTMNFAVTTSIVNNIKVDAGTLTVTTSTSTGQVNTRRYSLTKNGDRFCVSIQFKRVGTYDFSKVLRLRAGEMYSQAVYITPQANVISENANIIKSERLIINGYTAKYALTSTQTAPLYNDTYSYATMTDPDLQTQSNVIFAEDLLTMSSTATALANTAPTTPNIIYTADFTFLNENINTLSKTYRNANTNKNTIFSAFTTQNTKNAYACTDLGPVTFEYYGKLNLGNTTDSPSWYAYKSPSGEITVNRYSLGLVLEDPGEYLVHLTYENVIYDGSNETTYGSKYKRQLFHFEITNTTPDVQIWAVNGLDHTYPIYGDEAYAKALYSKDYTNKYVYLSWQNPGPFDAKLNAKYSVYDWDNNLIKEDVTINGVIYQRDGGNTADVTASVYASGHADLLYGENVIPIDSAGVDGRYIIKIYKNDSQTNVSYTFNIDTAPISNIGALQIDGSLIATNNNSLVYLSKLTANASDYNFLINHQFAWTWSDKLSGASITAKYVGATITQIANFNLDTTIDQLFDNNGNIKTDITGKVMIPTDVKLGGFSPAVEYIKASTESLETALNSAQIISNNQLAILLLQDQAGNKAFFATLLDNSKPQIIQMPEATNSANMITEDTTFCWGTHKAISTTDVSTPDDSLDMADIYDFINAKSDTVNNKQKSQYAWYYRDTEYVASATVKDAFVKMIENNYLVLPISQVVFNGQSASSTLVREKEIVPSIDNSNIPHNWFAIVTVNNINGTYGTQILPDGQLDANYSWHALSEGEYEYNLKVADSQNNATAIPIRINLDKSKGSLYSYSQYRYNESSYSESLDVAALGSQDYNRRYVPNNYGSNRNIITFTWTDPVVKVEGGDDLTIQIEEIKLDFYAYVYDKDAKTEKRSADGTIETDNDGNPIYEYTYPFSATPTKSIIIYRQGGESDIQYKQFESPAGSGSNWYQTNILQQVYSTQASTASQIGKYVITRKYSDEFNNLSSQQQGGDSLFKPYTYYIDRNSMLPSNKSYSDDVNLKFGYESYHTYPDYGNISFNEFTRALNNDTFNSLSFNYTSPTSSTPTSTLIDSNILPVGIEMKLWGAESNLHDKYYNSSFEALTQLNDLLSLMDSKYNRVSRTQVIVQCFKPTSANSSQKVLSSQKFYSTSPSPASDFANFEEYMLSYPLSKLKEEFKDIGIYRVFVFDLMNTDMLITGNPYTDFDLYKYETLYPNYTIFNFEVNGNAPKFNYQSGKQTSSSYNNVNTTITATSTIQITNNGKLRISWSDPKDIYDAKIAFNDVVVSRTIYTKLLPKIKADGSAGTGIVSDPQTYMFPITLICTEDEVATLTAKGYRAFDANNYALYCQNGIYTYLKKNTQAELYDLINGDYDFQNYDVTMFFKMEVDGINNYYLILPQATLEDAEKYQNKFADVEYTANIHYIGNKEDYEVNVSASTTSGTTTKSDKYFTTVKTIYVDNTAPYLNLQDLIRNDVYINSISTNFANYLIDNIDNNNVTFLKTYAFAVAPDFIVKSQNPYDTSTQFYYKKYSNYTGKKNEQTVVEGQPDYATAINKFSPGISTYLIGKYGTTKFTETGYYDIIEQDTAGNLRVYTIFVTNREFNIYTQSKGAEYQIKSKQANKTSQQSTIEMLKNSELMLVPNLEFSDSEFQFSRITSPDKWFIIEISNIMGTESLSVIYSPIADTSGGIIQFDGTLQSYATAGKYELYSDFDELVKDFNNFISKLSTTYKNQYGSRVVLTIKDRLYSTQNFNMYINTAGIQLINSEEDFLSLITVNANNSSFNIVLPNSVNTPSTYLTDFSVWNNNYISTDSDGYLISVDDVNATTIGYNFTLANNYVYRFTFRDNFERECTYAYPFDSSLIKRLIYTGDTTKQDIEIDNNTVSVTCTSNDVIFEYQVSGLYVMLTVLDRDSGQTIFDNTGPSMTSLEDENSIFTYSRTIFENTAKLTFLSTIGINYYVTIYVYNNTDVPTIFEFLLYTHLPVIILTDTSGSPILNSYTSKETIITWQELASDTLFSPRVELTYPNGRTERIVQGISIKDYGNYTIRIYNSIGEYLKGRYNFVIKEYDISIYGVYQKVGSEMKLLLPHVSEYNAVIEHKSVSIPHYLFLSNNSSWEDNIAIVCNDDKNLKYELYTETGSGRTRIYHIYGRTTHKLDLYFAITRIIPTINISTYTNFRVDGSIVSKNINDIKTSATVLTWQTNYTDATTEGQFVYQKFFYLEIRYNGTLLGNFTEGSVTLQNAGTYQIRVLDVVDRVQYFGINTSSTTYTITLLTNVIYTVNDNMAIQYAIYSDPVDVYIPNLEYYDATPTVTIYRNNNLYNITHNNWHYTFTEPGVYRLTMEGTIQNIKGTDAEPLSATYQFQIISKNEALQNFNFPAMNGYEITKVVRSGEDITALVNHGSKIISLYVDSDNFGIGHYQVTVTITGQEFSTNSLSYNFEFWINNEEVSITPSREWGSSSTASFYLTVNTANIYEKIGKCYIIVNSEKVLAINEENAELIEPTTIGKFTKQGDYVIQLVSESGNILQSHRITIQEPMNTATIILIVIASIVAVVLIITFIFMRNKVKVR